MVNLSPVIFVCQGKSCSQDGAKEIIADLEKKTLGKIEIKTKFCFGKCGNGPIVVVLPEEKWFYNTKLEQLNFILDNL